MLTVALGTLVACSSPEEKALEFLESGNELLARGDRVRARLEFQNALQFDQRLLPAWYGLAQIAQREGDWDSAFTLLGNVLEIDPGHLHASVERGRILLATGQIEQALELSDRTLTAAPEDPAVMSLRAALLYRLGDPAGAAELARKALDIDPGEVNALIVLATERITSGDAEQALAYLAPAIERDEGNVVLQLIRIEALRRINDPLSAERVYLQLIALYPEVDAFRLELAAFYLAQFREVEAEQIFRERVRRRPGELAAFSDLLRFLQQVGGPARAKQELVRAIEAEPNNLEYRFLLADLQERSGEHESALATLAAIVGTATSPSDRHRAQAIRAGKHWQSGDRQTAVAIADRILQEDPGHARALVLKTTWQIEQRELDDAIANLRTLLKDAPEFPEALLLLARAYELSGSGSLADETYHRAFRASQGSAEIGVAYAQFLVQGRRLDRAATVLQQALQRSPEYLDALALLARVRVAEGDWASAQQLADRVSAVKGGAATSEELRGLVYSRQQRSEQSIAAFERAFRSSGSGTRPMVLLVRAYAEAGDYAGAHGFVDSVLAATPRSETALLLKGQLCHAQSDFECAIAAFQAVTDQNPGSVSAHRYLVATRLRAGGADQALAAMDAALQANPASFDLRLLQASLLEQSGDYEKAISVYEALHIERPDADVVANNLASALVEQSADEARTRRALELAARFSNSEVPHFKDTLGWANYRAGNLKTASALLGDAVKTMPFVPVFRYHYGMSLLALGDADSARIELQAALELAEDTAFSYRGEVEEAIAGLR